MNHNYIIIMIISTEIIRQILHPILIVNQLLIYFKYNINKNFSLLIMYIYLINHLIKILFFFIIVKLDLIDWEAEWLYFKTYSTTINSRQSKSLTCLFDCFTKYEDYFDFTCTHVRPRIIYSMKIRPKPTRKRKNHNLGNRIMTKYFENPPHTF